MIEILASNKLYIETLKQALSPFLEKDISNPDVSLFIAIITDTTPADEQKKIINHAKKTAIFLILAEPSLLSDKEKKYFDMIFDMPMRLGFLYKHVQSFYQKKLAL